MNKFKNKVFNEDVLKVLKSMPDNSVDMIYSDPDYNVGIKYNDNNYTRNFKEYIEWYVELARESFRVLKPEGNMFFINYPRQNSFLWVNYLDEACYDVNEIVWVYNTNVGHSPRKFTTAHRSILHCTKTKENKWFKNEVAEPYKNPNDKRILENIKNGSKGRMPYSWLYYDLVKNVSKDKTIHACQIPLGLVETLIKASTNKDDLIFIHFGGSGSEIVLTKDLKRNFISAEIDEIYFDLIQKRLKQNGKIPSEYKLKIGNYKESDEENLALFEKNKKKYGT